jgi:phenylalanine-4-hydroxylase
VAGEKERVATTLSHLAEEVLLQEVFKVDQVCRNYDPKTMDTTYFLIKDKDVVCKMTFDDVTPIEDRVTAIRVAMRMQHGNDSEVEGGSPP